MGSEDRGKRSEVHCTVSLLQTASGALYELVFRLYILLLEYY